MTKKKVLGAKKTRRTTKAKDDAMALLTCSDKARFNANVPADLYKQVKIKAIDDGVTLNDLAVRWMNAYINE